MKAFVVLAVGIVLVGIFFCPMVMAAPSRPADLQMVQPDPSLPKELSAFFGKWEWGDSQAQLFLIVEKIDEEKASLYIWRSGWWIEGTPLGWERIGANVTKDSGKYKLWYHDRYGNIEYTLKGEYLVTSGPTSVRSPRLRRVP